MKKKILTIISLFLVVVMLASCASTGDADTLFSQLGEGIQGLFGKTETAETRTAEAGLVKFSEMEYSRPDVDAFFADIDAVNELLSKENPKLKDALALLERVDADYCDFYTMRSLADIHNCIDLTDEYYAAEYEWIDGVSSEVSQALEHMYYICAGSPLGAKLEEEFFWEGFCEDYADESNAMYTDAFVALQQQESELLARYRELCADPTVEINGKTVNWNDAMNSATTNREYFAALYSFYDQYCDRFADVFISLMKVRNEMASEAGYADYREMQFDYMFDRDYTPEEAQSYLEDIATYMAPLYEVTENSDIFNMLNTFYVSENDLKKDMLKLTAALGGDIAEAYEFMIEWELSDVTMGINKAHMSFETYLYNYDVPFVFMDAECSSNDILTYAHEFGHFTDDYVNYGASETIDVAETFSQGMEMLALDYLTEFTTQYNADIIKASKFYDIVGMYCQQAAFAEFENRIYAMDPDTLDADSISAVMREVEAEFGFYIDTYDKYYSRLWMDITHFFEYPFYVISYPVSNDVPMQIYAIEKETPGAGLALYNSLLTVDHTSLLAMIEEAGLQSPFAEGRIKDVAEVLEEFFVDFGCDLAA